MPAVARKGDRGVPHCSSFTIATGSSDVNVNSNPVARIGDSSTTHLRPASKKCKPHVSKINRGSNTVFVNGRAIARVGDSLAGCTTIAQGSSNVNAG